MSTGTNEGWLKLDCNDVVLTEIGFDPERISNHCRGVTKRGR